MQEAYRPPCSEYSFCCPNWVPPLTGPGKVHPPPAGPGRVPPQLDLAWYPPPPGQGTPPGWTWHGTLQLDLAGYPPGQGTPPPGWTWQGTPPLDLAGYPLAGPGDLGTWQGTPPPLDLAGYPPGCPMAFWVMLQSIMGYGYPPCGQTEGQTRVKTLPSRRTTYTGGKDSMDVPNGCYEFVLLAHGSSASSFCHLFR